MLKSTALLALIGSLATSLDSVSAWDRVNGFLEQISYDDNQFCGVNTNHDIFCADQNIFSSPNWRQLPGSLKWASVSGDYIWGANDNDDVFVGSSHGDPNWVQVPGKLKQISPNGHQICGVNSANEVFCATEGITSNPTWVQLPGLLQQVDVSPTDRIYGVSAPGQTWFWSRKNNAFTSVPTGGVSTKQLSFGDGGFLCGTDTNDGVFCASSGLFVNPVYFQIPGALRQITILGSRVFGVNANSEIYTLALSL